MKQGPFSHSDIARIRLAAVHSFIFRRVDRGRSNYAVLALIVVAGLTARALPLLASNSSQTTAGFDEGVYLSAAGLLSVGELPYRDFVFLHPPGIMLLLWPVASLAPNFLGWDDFLSVCRWLSVFVGVVNIVLVAVLGRRWRGWPAALMAAAIYAAYAPAVGVESHLVLEPFVNLAVLLGAYLWLSPRTAQSTRRTLIAGALLGGATLVKLTGGLAVVALVASERLRGAWRPRLLAVAGAASVFLIVITPFVATAGPGRLWELLIGAQLDRPGGDVAGGSIAGLPARISSAVGIGFLGTGTPAVAFGLILFVPGVLVMFWAWRRGGQDGRFWAALSAVVLVSILWAPDFYAQYPVPLGPGLAITVGGALAAAIAHLRQYERRAVRMAAPLAWWVLLSGALVVGIAEGWKQRPESARDFGAEVRARIGAGDCLIADPPALGLAANKLPPRDRSGSALADPFGALLVPAIRARALASTPAALTSPAAQHRERLALASCQFVALGVKPDEDGHFSLATKRWFVGMFHPLGPVSEPPTLWVRVGVHGGGARRRDAQKQARR